MMLYILKSVCALGFISTSMTSVHATGCLPGFWGNDCEHGCGQCSNKSCDVDSGACITGCLDGFTGDSCDNQCANHTYGLGCTESCGHCYGNESCHRESGHCMKWCEAGWYGLDCKTPCAPGLYDFNCEARCGSCSEGACDPITGGCSLAGCSDNYEGPRCDTCVDGFYSASCGQVCGFCLGLTICNKVTGECPFGCEPGFVQPFCTDKDNTKMKTVIVGTLAGTVSLIIAVLLLFLYKLQKSQEEENVAEKDDIGHTDDNACDNEFTIYGISTTEPTKIEPEGQDNPIVTSIPDSLSNGPHF